MRNGVSGHRNKGAEVEFWGVEGREMGFNGIDTRPKLGKRRKGTIHFAIIRACKTASFVDIKHGKNTPKPRF